MAMQPELERFFNAPSRRPAAEVLAAIEAGPVDPTRCLDLADVDRLREPAPLEVETGWCRKPDGISYVAVRTELPGTTAEMWDWWFDWHPRDPDRYRVWFPEAHFGTKFQPPHWQLAKPFWGAVHFPDEDVGTGREVLRIAFLPPTAFGFSDDALEDPAVGTIVCGHVGSVKRRARFGAMSHVFLRTDDGLILRSHFWLGAVLRPDLPGGVGDSVGKLVNRPFVRKRAIPHAAAPGLARHCADEYSRLGGLLPELYEAFAG